MSSGGGGGGGAGLSVTTTEKNKCLHAAHPPDQPTPLWAQVLCAQEALAVAVRRFNWSVTWPGICFIINSWKCCTVKQYLPWILAFLSTSPLQLCLNKAYIRVGQGWSVSVTRICLWTSVCVDAVLCDPGIRSLGSLLHSFHFRLAHFLCARVFTEKDFPDTVQRNNSEKFKASSDSYLSAWLRSSRLLSFMTAAVCTTTWQDKSRQVRATQLHLSTGTWWIRPRRKVTFSLLSGPTAQDTDLQWSITMATDRHLRGVGSPPQLL